MSTCGPSCASCSSASPARAESLTKLGVRISRFDYVAALAGNPNTGKSTIFNALTGLRQHTGNWPGKTIARAEGAFSYGDKRFKLVDLPGTYSLLSASQDEQIARDFILFGRPDVTVVVADATRLERNLNLVLQVLQITDRAVVCVNLVDEAAAHGLSVDCRGLARDLGVPVVLTAARQGQGMETLLKEMLAVASGQTVCRPRRLTHDVPETRGAIAKLTAMLRQTYPNLQHVEWIAWRLLEGDPHIIEAITSGEFGESAPPAPLPTEAR